MRPVTDKPRLLSGTRGSSTPAPVTRVPAGAGRSRSSTVPAGGAKLTYTLFSDPAGSVPSFLVHGAQRKATRDAAMMSLEKTKKYLEAAK